MFQFSSFVFSCMLSSVVCCTAVSLCGVYSIQLQLCCTVKDKTAVAFLDQGSSPCAMKTHHGSGALWFVNRG